MLVRNPALRATIDGDDDDRRPPRFANDGTRAVLERILDDLLRRIDERAIAADDAAAIVQSLRAFCTEPAARDYRIVMEPGSLVVRFAAPGACLAGPGHRILQPVNADGSSVFRSGSTVVLKLRVCDAAGRSIGAAGTIAELRRTATVEGTAVRAVNETVVRALPDRAFRWDPVEQLWVMNLDTCGLRSRHTHSYQVTLADGSTITFRFGLR